MVYLGGRYLRPVVNKKNFLSEFPNSYGKKSVKPKLIAKGLNLLDVCIDLDGTIIPGKTTLMISSDGADSLKVLLGIINSPVAFFYLKEKYPASSYNQGTTFTKDMINNLPLPNLQASQRSQIISRVDRILAAKAKDAEGGTGKLEREIDELVYSLYDLTPIEIETIEKSLK